MRTVRIDVDLTDSEYGSFLKEGQRRGESVESLLKRTLENLLREMELEELEGTDRPIIVS